MQLVLQENGYPIQSKPLTIQVFPYRYQSKETTQSRLAQILQKTIAKHHVAAGTNDLPPNNEKRKTYAYRNLLKRKRLQPEHKTPNRYVEVAMNSLHRIQADYIPVNPRQPTFPRRSG